mmetsp:Transcript_105685/g.183719  ORF Transcript_105685/g.183719 Transcript_105685/m.183719 type:complete len:185 (-) Transcript_105685:183-737(-)
MTVNLQLPEAGEYIIEQCSSYVFVEPSTHSERIGNVKRLEVIVVEESKHVKSDGWDFIFAKISSPMHGWVSAWSKLGEEPGDWKIKAKARPLVLTLRAQKVEDDTVDVIATSISGDELCRLTVKLAATLQELRPRFGSEVVGQSDGGIERVPFSDPAIELVMDNGRRLSTQDDELSLSELFVFA